MDLFGEEGGGFSQKLVLPLQLGDSSQRGLVGDCVDRLRGPARHRSGRLPVPVGIHPASERVLRNPQLDRDRLDGVASRDERHRLAPELVRVVSTHGYAPPRGSHLGRSVSHLHGTHHMVVSFRKKSTKNKNEKRRCWCAWPGTPFYIHTGAMGVFYARALVGR